MEAELRYYMGIEPNSLSDYEFALRWRELEWIRKKEAEANRVK